MSEKKYIKLEVSNNDVRCWTLNVENLLKIRSGHKTI